MENPYIYKQPIGDPAHFYPRVSEIMRITSRLAADRPQSVSVVGGPYSGKTSLLNYLYDEGVRAEYLSEPEHYVFLYLQLKAQCPKKPEGFFALMDAALQEVGEAPMPHNYEGFNQLVRELMGQGRKLVVLCDDFELVTQNSGFPLDFFSFMRSIANSNEVGYVTTSPALLQEMCHTQDIEESPFFNIFTTVNLEPFKLDGAHRVVVELAKEVGVDFEGETDWVVELAGGNPYLLQLTAHWAFAGKMAGGLQQEALLDQAFKEARSYLEVLWESYFSEAERSVLQAVQSQVGIDARLRYAADNLVRYGFLAKEDNEHRIAIGLLERYVKGTGKGGFWKRLFG